MNNFLISITYWIWHPFVHKVIYSCYVRGLIDDRQLHEILARFDKTQIYYEGKR